MYQLHGTGCYLQCCRANFENNRIVGYGCTYEAHPYMRRKIQFAPGRQRRRSPPFRVISNNFQNNKQRLLTVERVLRYPGRLRDAYQRFRH